MRWVVMAAALALVVLSPGAQASAWSVVGIPTVGACELVVLAPSGSPPFSIREECIPFHSSPDSPEETQGGGSVEPQAGSSAEAPAGSSVEPQAGNSTEPQEG